VPKSSFASTNVRASGTSFPVLKLDKIGDNTRIKLAEAEPTFEWVHQLRAPRLSNVTGQLVMKTIEVGKGDDKETREVPDLEYVGSPICHGADDALSDRGIDPDNCVMCKAALDHSEWFEKPERKWAVHVFEYACQGNTSKAAEPISIQVKVFKMTERRYARVVAVLEEFAENGNVLDVDLTLGPCNSPKFQNYEIQGAPRCVLAANPKKLAEAEEIFQGNNAGDLSAYCGRKSDPRYTKSDVDSIIAKWQSVSQGGNKIPEPDFSSTLSGSLIDQQSGSKKEEAPAASLADLDDTVGSPAAAEEPETATTSAIPQSKAKESNSFSDIMAGLNLDMK